jgi:hypothetical protein
MSSLELSPPLAAKNPELDECPTRRHNPGVPVRRTIRRRSPDRQCVRRPIPQAIADQLDISIRTVRNKLGVHSQLKAVLFALRYAIIDER